MIPSRRLDYSPIIDRPPLKLPDGARLTFSTDDPDLVNALHRWAEAQTTDHGEHADNAHS